MNMRPALPIIFSLGISQLFAACGNDNGGTPIDGGTAGVDTGVDVCTLEPNFTSLYNGLFTTPTCNTNGCHNTAAHDGAGGNLIFAAGKDAAYMELTNETTFDTGAGLMRVKASDAANSFLYLKVTQDMPPGTSKTRMPLLCDLTGMCLATCQTDAIKDWINAGAPNN